jgi:anti-sigma factor RsiW
MKCRKAHNLYFASRDGTLEESGRMKLARHLSRCPSCALFMKEMDASLDSVKALPELTAPEGFEWNVKRRILQERTKLMRREHVVPFGGRRWLSRFAVGAAAAAAVVVLAALFGVQWLGNRAPSVKEVAQEHRAANTTVPVSSMGEGTIVDFSAPGSFTGPRMVSDNVFSVERGGESVRQAPFQFVAGSREDSLARENEILKVRIQSLERQIMLLRSMLDKERTRQINMSLP